MKNDPEPGDLVKITRLLKLTNQKFSVWRTTEALNTKDLLFITEILNCCTFLQFRTLYNTKFCDLLSSFGKITVQVHVVKIEIIETTKK